MRTIISTTALMVFLATLSTGCGDKIIQRAEFTLSEDLKTAEAELIFTEKVKIGFNHEFAVKDYGYIFLSGYQENIKPFSAGFQLKTEIVNDQDYVRLTPTTTLPNGLSLGLPNPVVEVRGAQPIHDQFDLLGYVDVLKLSWLGGAVVFKLSQGQDLPEDLMVTQVFMRSSSGNPLLFAHAFGPVHDDGGTLTRQSGVAVFADVRGLVEGGFARPGERVSFKPEPKIELSGKNADLYRNNPRKLRELQEQIIRALNKNQG